MNIEKMYDELQGEICNLKRKLGESGGGGYNETVLYSGTATAASYALSDSVENYDLIYISATYRNNSNQDLVVTQVYPSTILIAAVDTDQVFSVTSDYYYSNFEMTDTQTITKISESYLYINKVIGIKF